MFADTVQSPWQHGQITYLGGCNVGKTVLSSRSSAERGKTQLRSRQWHHKQLRIRGWQGAVRYTCCMTPDVTAQLRTASCCEQTRFNCWVAADMTRTVACIQWCSTIRMYTILQQMLPGAAARHHPCALMHSRLSRIAAVLLRAAKPSAAAFAVLLRLRR